MHTHIQERISKIQHGEVPEGYQKTKVGIIPDGWSVKRLGHIFKLSSGKTKPSDLIGFKSNEYQYPVYGGNGIIGYCKAYIEAGNKIIIGRVGEYCGNVNFSKNECWITDNALYIHEWLTDSYPFFYRYLLKYIELSRLRNKGGQPLISQKPIYARKIMVPPLPEQQKIAEILSAWDDGIHLQHELIEQKKTQKRGLMQVLLSGKIRVTEMGTLSPEAIKKRVADIQQGIVPEGYQKTKVGIIPDSWKVTPLNTIASRVVSINDGGQYPVLTISAASGFLNQSERFSKVIAGKNIEKYLLLQKYDFAYNKGNSKTYPQGCVYCLTGYECALVPNVYYCFRLSDNSIAYYKHYFLAGQLNQQLKKIINSGVRNDGLLNLNVSDFFKVLVLQPPVEEQQKIADILTTADKEIELLESELAQLQEQKKDLMQLLLTGTIRVHEVQERGMEKIS